MNYEAKIDALRGRDIDGDLSDFINVYRVKELFLEFENSFMVREVDLLTQLVKASKELKQAKELINDLGSQL